MEYFIEQCGLSVDVLAPEGHYTPLTYACCFSRVDDEMLLVQVVKYLLDNGADATSQTAEGRVAEKIAITSKLGEVYNLLVKHRRAQQAYRARKKSATTEVVDAASFAAKQREAEEAAQALLAELDAEETYTDTKRSKKGKGGNGGEKKKDGDGNKQGPAEAERKEKKEEGDAGRRGEAVDDREGADTKSGQGQHGSQSKERDALLATYPLGLLEHPLGKQLLSSLATQAAQVGDRDKVLFFVNEMGVPVNAARALIVPNATENKKLASAEFTPLVGAISNCHEDLALELLALSDQGNLDSELPFFLSQRSAG